MTSAEFRQLALSFPEAIESAHMDHPDFRVGRKIFATLARGEEYGVLMLSPEEQKELCAAEPRGFSPVPGGWGEKGSTRVHLETVRVATLEHGMKLAWQKRAPKRLVQE